MLRYHQTLKSVIGTSRQFITGLIQCLLTMSEVRHGETSHKHFYDLMKSTGAANPCLEYRKLFTSYACQLIEAEFKKVTEKNYTISEV